MFSVAVGMLTTTPSSCLSLLILSFMFWFSTAMFQFGVSLPFQLHFSIQVRESCTLYQTSFSDMIDSLILQIYNYKGYQLDLWCEWYKKTVL